MTNEAGFPSHSSYTQSSSLLSIIPENTGTMAVLIARWRVPFPLEVGVTVGIPIKLNLEVFGGCFWGQFLFFNFFPRE